MTRTRDLHEGIEAALEKRDPQYNQAPHGPANV